MTETAMGAPAQAQGLFPGEGRQDNLVWLLG